MIGMVSSHKSVLAAPPRSLDHALRQYRTEQAYIRAVPPASVFSNALLRRIVQSRPSTLSALCRLNGIGQTRRLHYGNDIVRLVNLQAKGRRVCQAPPTARLARKRGAKQAQRKAVNGNPQKKIIKKTKTVSTPCILAEKEKAFNATERKVVSRFFLPAPEMNMVSENSGLNCNNLHCNNLNSGPNSGPNSGLNSVHPRVSRQRPSQASVYILELEDGRVYVGSSKDIPRRLAQHKSGAGSAYTRVYKPTGVMLPRLGNVQGDGDAAERDETLRYMMQRGVPFVRGWKFARVDMPPEECEEAEANIRELFDLCRRCGYKGHFCTHCKATFDRLGNAIEKRNNCKFFKGNA